ncbi:MAG: ABC transporter ATP-binding protein/permease [Pseudomonadales bacterium]|nr:ABC transporter ATP-binding protein/permease [Pseudomonadales bacterium]
MSIFRSFVARYPGQSVVLVLALLLSGLAGSVGLSAVLPVLNIAFDSDSADQGAVERVLTDALASVGIEPNLAVLLGIIVIAVFFKAVLVFFAEVRIGYIAADVATDLRMRLLRAILRSKWSYFTQHSPGKLANSMSTEAFRASRAFVTGVKLVALAIESVVYASFALAVSATATLLSIVAGTLILLASRSLVRIARDGGNRQTIWYRQLLSTLTDTLQSVKSFKSMGREYLADEVLAEDTEQLRKALKREELGVAAMESALEPMYGIVIALGLWVSVMVFDVEMTTITFLVIVLANLLKQVGKLQKQYQRLQTYESAYWAMEDNIDVALSEAEPKGGRDESGLAEEIRLEKVDFAYANVPVLQGVSLKIPARTLTCLVGESGSGKSTITDLVMGLIRPDAGRVFVDGVDLTTLDLARWRHQIGYVPQENLLLHASVRLNLTLGDPGVDDEMAERALRAADAWDFVSALADGLETTVGERGTLLSGGQRQRILIARALLWRPRLLILDEATSSLDPESDRAIAATLKALSRELTVLVVAHQSALTEAADHVYRLERGRMDARAEAPGA